MYSIMASKGPCFAKRNCHLPMCQSEFGPATEYFIRAVSPPGIRRAVLSGSCARTISRNSFLVTRYPIALSLPRRSVCPRSGASKRICLKSSLNIWSLGIMSPSASKPYVLRRRYTVTREIPSREAIFVHENESILRNTTWSLLTWNFGLPLWPV